jgi:hypothetical protein
MVGRKNLGTIPGYPRSAPGPFFLGRKKLGNTPGINPRIPLVRPPDTPGQRPVSARIPPVSPRSVPGEFKVRSNLAAKTWVRPPDTPGSVPGTTPGDTPGIFKIRFFAHGYPSYPFFKAGPEGIFPFFLLPGRSESFA